MKRYLLFYSQYYYPAGAKDDFLIASSDMEEIIKNIDVSKLGEGWWEIFDCLNSEFIFSTYIENITEVAWKNEGKFKNKQELLEYLLNQKLNTL